MVQTIVLTIIMCLKKSVGGPEYVKFYSSNPLISKESNGSFKPILNIN